MPSLVNIFEEENKLNKAEKFAQKNLSTPAGEARKERPPTMYLYKHHTKHHGFQSMAVSNI